MEPDPNNDFRTEDFTLPIDRLPGSFMLSYDLKDGNCFLGDPHLVDSQGTPFDNFPAARMADLGHSTVFCFDQDNRRSRIPRGTEIWMVPVSWPGYWQERKNRF